MLRPLFEKQRRSLDYFFTHLDYAACQMLFERVYQLEGTLFLSGVGKSGFIAQKIASTILSTGTKAFFLPPLDALHGDLGMVTPHDLVLLLSKSGETDELIELMTALRAKRAAIGVITSNPDSRLVKGADFFVTLPCEQELCPFDLAPTTSAELQLLFGDVLAIGLMERKQVTLAEYAQNHPSGRIGRRATLKVKDLMLDQTRTPFCKPDHSLEEVLVEFTDKRCGCLLVIDQQQQLQGIFTDGDLRRALQTKGPAVLQEKIAALMTRTPKSIHADEMAWEAIKIMEGDPKHPVMVLPVVEREQGTVIGIIKMHDLIQAGI